MDLFLKIIVFFSVILFYSCGNKEIEKLNKETGSLPDQAALKTSLANLSNLGTVEYSLSKIISASDDQWYSVGSRKALMSCKANVIAGVDFAKIQISALNQKEKSVSITMPPAQVILLDIPPADFKIISIDEGTFRAKFTAQELNHTQQLAQKDIEQKITKLKILDDAKDNATRFLQSWLKSLGFKVINIS
jgi:hypothetical protein